MASSSLKSWNKPSKLNVLVSLSFSFVKFILGFPLFLQYKYEDRMFAVEGGGMKEEGCVC